jgi:pimeloyl-ACP methyl ester carboxylesterase
VSPETPAPRRRGLSAKHIRGAARLAGEGTAGLVDLVEAVHAGIARVPLLEAAPANGRTRGLTGLIYRTVRGVTRLVGGSVDALLGLLAHDLAEDSTASLASPGRASLLAALNGVLGDHLEASHNPLAIEMGWRHQGLPLRLERAALLAALPQPRPAVALLIHGLCMHDGSWRRGLAEGQPGVAETLAELGFTPLALHYNTGRSIADNGASLSALIDALVAAWPVPLERLVIVGHSMGGLVARSALHQAGQAGPALRSWPARVSDLVCLGTPHQGAPLEQLGHAVTALLAATPYASPFARLARLRSAGITDLRHGAVRGDAKGDVKGDASECVPLPAGVRCFAVAGTLGEAAGAVRQRVVGDGLVPLDSALGRHADPARALQFAEQRTCVLDGVGHLALMTDPGVLSQLRTWLAPPADAPPVDQSATASR